MSFNIIIPIILIFILPIIIFIALRNFNKNRVFLSDNIYGTNYYIFYKLGKILR